jgi:hypothetical protein
VTGSFTAHAGPHPGGPDQIDLIVSEAIAQTREEPGGPIARDYSLRDDLGFDSIMLMRLKFTLERRLPGLSELTLRDMLEHLTTPEAVAAFLRRRLTAGSGAR